MGKFHLARSTAPDLSTFVFAEIRRASRGTKLALVAILIIVLAASPRRARAQETQSQTTESSSPNSDLTIPSATESHAPADAGVQLVEPPRVNRTAPPVTVTLQDAIERARRFETQALAATSEAKILHEDRMQARNAMLPQISATTQYLNTEGDGGTISNGRFVTNDGVHVYRAWGVFHEDLRPRRTLPRACIAPMPPQPWRTPRLKSPAEASPSR